MTDVFSLPPALNVYSALETRDALLAWASERVHKADHLDISARNVEEVDGAGLQLLAALSNMDQDWHLIDTNVVFTEACRTMGLGLWLDARYLQAGWETAA
jgi:anti-anti-sigma regulatory factor